MRQSLPCLVALAIALTVIPLVAFPTPLAMASATFEVAPGFLPDPQSMSGTAVGERNVRRIQDVPDECTGWVGRVPNVRVHVEHTMPWMRLEVSAASHFALLLREPGGTWRCVSRDAARSARIDGTWRRGHYEVYVMVPEGEQLPYTLQFTERRLPPTTRSLADTGSLGPVLPLTVDTLRDGIRATGTSEDGRQQTPEMTTSGPCIGRLRPTPSHRLTVEAPLERVTFRVRSQADTMLRLENAETGQIFCNDDTFGLDPYLDLPLGAGTWILHVGTVLGEPAAYTLEILAEPTETPPRGAVPAPPQPQPRQTPDAPPPTDSDRTSNFGDAVVSDALPPTGLRLQGVSGGDEDTEGLRGVDDTPCEGMIHERPDHLLILQGAHDLHTLHVLSDARVSLVVDGPSGVYCAPASSEGAALEGPWPDGTYRIFVGSVTPGFHAYTLNLLPEGAARPTLDP